MESVRFSRLTFFMPKVCKASVSKISNAENWGQRPTLSATIFVDEGFAFFSSFLGGMIGDGERRQMRGMLPDRKTKVN